MDRRVTEVDTKIRTKCKIIFLILIFFTLFVLLFPFSERKNTTALAQIFSDDPTLAVIVSGFFGDVGASKVSISNFGECQANPRPLPIDSPGTAWWSCFSNDVATAIITANDIGDGSIFLGGSETGDPLNLKPSPIVLTIDRSNLVVMLFGFPVTVSKTGTGTGTVTSVPFFDNPTINCGNTCSLLLPFRLHGIPNNPSNYPIILTATAEPGSIFTGWSGACSGTSACILPWGAPRSVTANFELIEAKILTKESGDGQTGRIGQTLPQMLVVRVTDSTGKGVSGEPITFSLSPQDPGVSLSTTFTTTDLDGRAKTSLTLGKLSGKSYTVTATCSTCNPQTVSFTEKSAKVTLKLTAENSTLWPDKTSGDPKSSNITVEATDGLEATLGSISGYDVKLDVEPIASTGHNHGVHPKDHAGRIPSSCMIENGICSLTYTAPEISGKEKINAEGADDPDVKGEQEMTIRVPDLRDMHQLPPLGFEQAWRYGSTAPGHGSTQFANEAAGGKLVQAAGDYTLAICALQFGAGNPCLAHHFLRIGDVSLEKGGLLDVNADWSAPYKHHREGKTIAIEPLAELLEFPALGGSQELQIDILIKLIANEGFHRIVDTSPSCPNCIHFEFGGN